MTDNRLLWTHDRIDPQSIPPSQGRSVNPITQRVSEEVVAAYNEVARSIFPAAKRAHDVIREDTSKVNFWEKSKPHYNEVERSIPPAAEKVLQVLREKNVSLNTSKSSLNLPSILLAKCVAEPVMKSWTTLNGTSDSW